jgi:uncharacterized damage-inducible protein DinB
MLTRELDGLAREVNVFPDDASLWVVKEGVTNSAGNLALHLAGNVQHFVGAVLGGTGYARDREAEFGRRSGTRAEVVAELARARAVVHAVLSTVPDTGLDKPMTHPMLPGPVPARRMLVHLCAHAGFHLGQAGYLRRIVTGDNHSVGPLPVQPLCDEPG